MFPGGISKDVRFFSVSFIALTYEQIRQGDTVAADIIELQEASIIITFPSLEPYLYNWLE
jgi:hypothetical protein